MRAIAAALVPLAVIAAASYDENPPPAHTGGFGEPTCASCHFDGPVDDGVGTLTVVGLPERYEPGAAYVIRVVLQREQLTKGGFQLASRSAEGAQAGALEPIDGTAEVTESNGVSYVHHTRTGTAAREPGEISWKLRWTAPAAPAEVRFHLVGNASNADASEFGDHIYTHAATVSPR